MTNFNNNNKNQSFKTNYFRQQPKEHKYNQNRQNQVAL